MQDPKSDKFTINLNVAGKPYPMTINRDKEAIYRRAEREINALVNEYKKRVRAESEQYLAMTALHIAARNVEMELSRSLGDDIDELVKLDAFLDNYLNEKK